MIGVLGGNKYMDENLTNDIEDKINNYIQDACTLYFDCFSTNEGINKKQQSRVKLLEMIHKLNEVERIAYSLTDKKTIYYVNLIDIIKHSLTMLSKDLATNEKDIYTIFSKYIERSHDMRIVHIKCKKTDIPDFFVYKEGIDNPIPVEIKLNEFNNKAFDQLKRYMNCYQSEFGIAVGSKCTVELPENIKFISIDELECLQSL